MSTSVLFDAPGPQTRRRHLLYSIVFAAILAAVLVWVFWKLKAAGEFDSEVFHALSQPNIWQAISDGLIATLKAAALAIVLAVVAGFLLAMGRLSDHAWLSVPCRLVIEFFRAVPVILLIIFIFGLLGGRGLATETRGLISLVGGLTLYNGSVLAEVFRAGIQAVPRGQGEAAYAVGMRKSQVMTLILTPQAVRFMLPTIISQCVVALKDTSLGFIATYTELLRELKLIAGFIDNYLMTYLLGALIYITLNSIVSVVATLLERRLGRDRSKVRATEAVVPAG
ncbi:MAG: amino acid ABC transporter permease [Nocardioides sp.]